MKKVAIVFILGICFGIHFSPNVPAEDVRAPARAGQFYPASKTELTQVLDNFLKNAKKIQIEGDIVAIWVPHAGYEFSGQIAANAYQLIQGRQYEAVILIGPSHYVPLKGASIGNWTAYQTPLGNAVVDTSLVMKIRSLTSLVSSVPIAHRYEHSVEVQLPFLQTVLPGVPIVPMLMSNLSYESSKDIAHAIVKAVGRKKVLLVASSDMSHFPRYKDAYEVDLEVLDLVSSYDAKKVHDTEYSLSNKSIPNLECFLCGTSALVTVMLASQELGAQKVKILPYANSGDVTGERDRVVGYGAAVFYRSNGETKRGGETMLDEIKFTKEEKNKLFTIARKSILCALRKERIPTFSVKEASLLTKRGVFVTLTNHGRLRGCIGHFAPDLPLYQIVSDMAVAAATQDYRFAYNPVTVKEMDEMDIKISILSEMKKVDSIDEIEVGKHGIWIKQGNRSGTYLPEVATEMGWNKIEFLEHCCAEKAGLPRDAWKKGADIYIYSSQILSEKE